MLLLLIYIIVNLIIQYSVWYCFKEPICDILYILTYPIKYFSTRYSKIFVGISLFGINLCISLIISMFTGMGNMIGIANLFSSLILSFIMIYDYSKLKSV